MLKTTFSVESYSNPDSIWFVQTLSPYTQCLKVIEKVAFNIASEVSNVYILSGQKFIKNAKKVPVWRVFQKLKLAVKQCYQASQF